MGFWFYMTIMFAFIMILEGYNSYGKRKVKESEQVTKQKELELEIEKEKSNRVHKEG